MNLKIKRLNADAVVPQYAHEGDSGFDLVAVSDVIIEPGETVKVATGLAFEIPAGFELQVRPRSGITAKTKLRVQLGTIDSNFRGEVSVLVDNIAKYLELAEIPTVDGEYVIFGVDGKYHHCSEKPSEGGSYFIPKGTRIAQAVLAPVVRAEITEVDELGDSVRGANGFGSSGVSSV